jgi:serine/threonine-protein kinase RsbT
VPGEPALGEAVAGAPAAGEQRLTIAGEEGIVAARQAAREAAQRLGFGVVDQSRIATAVSELARNVVRYATGGRGEIGVRPLAAPPRRVGIEIVVTDEGPGIADVELALREGFTSSTGLGIGLPGTRRLMDEMEIDSAPGRGTTVTIRKWRR